MAAEQSIIIDGGSQDGSVEWLQKNWHKPETGRFFIRSNSGRAVQMNAGADAAIGDMLLFLHADNLMPAGAKREILLAREQQSLWGRFDIEFSASGKNRSAMKVIALFMNIRSRLSSVATGDQAIFVDRVLFNAIGGFADLPIMEDVALSKVLKRHCVPYCSGLRTQTSARRWEHGGVVRTVLMMWYLRLAYFCGASPHRLARQYKNIR